MGTSSLIGFQDPDDGVIRAVGCHFDGYYDHVGRVLHEHYRDISKLRELIRLGNLSTLGPEIGEAYDHNRLFGDFSAREELRKLIDSQCTFYGRDYKRPDEGHSVYNSVEEFFGDEWYAYLYIDNDWWCDGEEDQFQYRRLSNILNFPKED